MYIETVGKGPPLVLIHGWAMHGGIFQPLLEYLSPHFEIHLIDLPGHGKSSSDQQKLTLESCAQEIVSTVPNAIYLGWSLGGLVGLQIAHAFPKACNALIMLAATPRFVVAEDWPSGMPVSVFENFGSELKINWRETLDRFLMLEAQGSEKLRDELRFLREHIYERGEPNAAALSSGLEILSNSDLRAYLPQLSMPNLWLAGRRDRLVSPEAMRSASSMAAKSQYHLIEGAGHAAFLTHGKIVADEILRFSKAI